MTADQLVVLLDFYQGTFEPKKHAFPVWNNVLHLQECGFIKPVHQRDYAAAQPTGKDDEPIRGYLFGDHYWIITVAGQYHIQALLWISTEGSPVSLGANVQNNLERLACLKTQSMVASISMLCAEQPKLLARVPLQVCVLRLSV